MEDKWVHCYHLTNQNVFEGSSIALSDLLLINAVPLWDSVGEMVEAAKAHTHKRTPISPQTHPHVVTHKAVFMQIPIFHNVTVILQGYHNNTRSGT